MKSNKVFLVLIVFCFLLFSFGTSFDLVVEASEISVVPPTVADWSYEGDQISALLGYSWAPAGDVNGDGFGDIIIGISEYNTSFSDAGRAIAFYGSPTGYGATPDWVVDGEEKYNLFGTSVSSAGDIDGDGYDDVLVGANEYSSSTESKVGKAYLYYGSATGLETTPGWTGTGTQQNEYFGFSVAGVGDLDGDGFDDFAVGAYGHDSEEGKLNVYYGPVDSDAKPTWTVESNQGYERFGYNVKGIGDVDGDGLDDLIVSAPLYDFETNDVGAVFAWYGLNPPPEASFTPDDADWCAQSDQTYIDFGSALGTPGDVNGDGFDDVVVGADSYNYDVPSSGAVFLWYGSEDGINNGNRGETPDADWVASSLQEDYHFGSLTGTRADINGDGYADLIIGSFWTEPGVYVFLGSEDGPNLGDDGDLTNADWQIIAPDTAEFNQSKFGWLAGSPGDADGDGVDDVAVAAPDYLIDNTAPNYHVGKIWAYYKNVSAVSGTATYTGSQSVTGPIEVSALLHLQDPPVASSVYIDSGETYTIYGLEGDYYLSAYLDVDHSSGPPDPNEPIGWYDGNSDGMPDLVSVSAGDNLTGKNIILTDPGSIRGTVTCGGCLGKVFPIRVSAHLSLTEPPIANANLIASGETYIINGLPAGGYYISAYLDLNNSGGPPDPGEPDVLYDSNGDGTPDKVVVAGGANVTGINMKLIDCYLYLPLILK